MRKCSGDLGSRPLRTGPPSSLTFLVRQAHGQNLPGGDGVFQKHVRELRGDSGPGRIGGGGIRRRLLAGRRGRAGREGPQGTGLEGGWRWVHLGSPNSIFLGWAVCFHHDSTKEGGLRCMQMQCPIWGDRRSWPGDRLKWGHPSLTHFCLLV